MKNSSSFGTIGILLAVVLSFFAFLPTISSAQNSVGTAGKTSGSTAAAAETEEAETEETTASTSTTPVFPTFNADYLTGRDPQPNTLPYCVLRQFGVKYQFLPAATQAEILKNPNRYSQLNSDCSAFKTPPPTFDFQQYVGTLMLGFILLLILVFSPLKSIIEEPETDQAPYLRHEEIAMQAAVAAVVNAGIAQGLSPAAIGGNARTAASAAITTIIKPAKKYSISRIIALIGLYLIVVTFIFTSDYAFWSLFVLGDNSIFEKAITTVLIGGIAAFTPYITNKIAEANKAADTK